MPNILHSSKRRVTYAEWSDVWVVVQQIAKRERKTPTDIVREAVLTRVNAELRTRGRSPLNPRNGG